MYVLLQDLSLNVTALRSIWLIIYKVFAIFHFPSRSFIYFFFFCISFFFSNFIFVNSKKITFLRTVTWKNTYNKFGLKIIITIEDAAFWKSCFRKFFEMHRVIPKLHWTLQGKGYPIYILLVPRIPNFTPFRFAIARVPDNWGSMVSPYDTTVNLEFSGKKSLKIGV